MRLILHSLVGTLLFWGFFVLVFSLEKEGPPPSPSQISGGRRVGFLAEKYWAIILKGQIMEAQILSILSLFISLPFVAAWAFDWRKNQ